jgi:hypothetical protein
VLATRSEIHAKRELHHPWREDASTIAFRGECDRNVEHRRPSFVPIFFSASIMAGLTGLQRELAEFSLTIDTSQPDSAPADLLNRAIWHSVKGFDTPYNYGRPIPRQHSSFELLLIGRDLMQRASVR